MKDGVVKMVVNFFEKGEMNNELNKTDMVLIPK